MKKIVLMILAAVTGCFGFAQTSHNNNSFICSYYGEPINTPITGFPSSSDARQVISKIIDVIGLEPTFEIRSASIPNAAAVISSGKRFILYNPKFISAINQAAKDKWASIAILAHEIGHHLNGHTLLGTGSRPSIELEADQFSGFVLRKMGASLEQAQLSMQLVATDKASRTHPARVSRLVSIENGWNKADAQITGGQYVARTIPSAPLASTAKPAASVSRTNSYALHPKYIQFNVEMFADNSKPYYITTANNFATIINGQVAVIGKVMSNTNNSFPLIIRSGGKTLFYISKHGTLITPRGQRAGSLQTNSKV